MLYIQLGFHGYFVLNTSLCFTFNSIRACKKIAKNHLDFKSTDHRKLACSLFFFFFVRIRSDSIGFDNDLQYR